MSSTSTSTPTRFGRSLDAIRVSTSDMFSRLESFKNGSLTEADKLEISTIRTGLQNTLGDLATDIKSSAAVRVMLDRVSQAIDGEGDNNNYSGCALVERWRKENSKAFSQGKEIYDGLHKHAPLFRSAQPNQTGSIQSASSTNGGGAALRTGSGSSQATTGPDYLSIDQSNQSKFLYADGTLKEEMKPLMEQKFHQLRTQLVDSCTDDRTSQVTSHLVARVDRMIQGRQELGSDLGARGELRAWVERDPKAANRARELYTMLVDGRHTFRQAVPLNEQFTAASTNGHNTLLHLDAPTARSDGSQRSGGSTSASGDSLVGVSLRSKL